VNREKGTSGGAQKSGHVKKGGSKISSGSAAGVGKTGFRNDGKKKVVALLSRELRGRTWENRFKRGGGGKSRAGSDFKRRREERGGGRIGYGIVKIVLMRKKSGGAAISCSEAEMWEVEVAPGYLVLRGGVKKANLSTSGVSCWEKSDEGREGNTEKTSRTDGGWLGLCEWVEKERGERMFEPCVEDPGKKTTSPMTDPKSSCIG